MSTTAEARTAYSNSVYDALKTNFNAADWAVIEFPDDPEYGCKTTLSAGVFTVDLTAFETLCTAAATDGCTFDKSQYVPYAFGWHSSGPSATTCDSGPMIATTDSTFSVYPSWV